MSNVIQTQSIKIMSSVELVEVINELREEGRTELLHKNFIAKIESHPGIDSAKFLAQYKDSTGRSLKCYHLPKRECELMVMSESLAVQTRVYDRMTALEQKLEAPTTETTKHRVSTRYREAEVIMRSHLRMCKMLGVADNMAKVVTAKQVKIETGLDCAPLLAVFTATQDIPVTPSALAEFMGNGIKASQVNNALVAAGLQEQHEKTNSKGKVSKTYTITESGRDYGSMEPFQSAFSDHVGYRPMWLTRVADVIRPLMVAKSNVVSLAGVAA